MLKNLGFDMTSSKKENGANRDQDEIGELGYLFQTSYTVIVQTGSNFTICHASAHSHCSYFDVSHIISVCEEGPGICSLLLTIGSLLLIFASLPLSLYVVVKVVQVRIL